MLHAAESDVKVGRKCTGDRSPLQCAICYDSMVFDDVSVDVTDWSFQPSEDSVLWVERGGTRTVELCRPFDPIEIAGQLDETLDEVVVLDAADAVPWALDSLVMRIDSAVIYSERAGPQTALHAMFVTRPSLTILMSTESWVALVRWMRTDWSDSERERAAEKLS